MSKTNNPTLTGVERHFSDDELIVTKTDLKGRITYANEVFLKISGYGEADLLGQPHSMIRHPDMPRAVFKLLWDRLHDREEIFAYVCNRCRNGDHYWVMAHVTPNVDANGDVVGYHSNRRTMPDRARDVIIPLYSKLVAIEQQGDRKQALVASSARLTEEIAKSGFPSYDRLILELGR